MGARLLAAALFFLSVGLSSGPASAALPLKSIALGQWQSPYWWRSCASLDLDFYNDRYYVNGNTSCDGTTGTQYNGVANFIIGTGATFTRAGTNNVTDTNPPFYLDTSQGQAFVSRASSSYNITTFSAPFYASSGGGQTWASRGTVATFFDSTGTLQSAGSGGLGVGGTGGTTGPGPRNASYYYNGSSWILGGLLLEPVSVNKIANNTMNGAVAGTPGTLPTGWISSGSTNGLTQTIVGTGTESGISYIDLSVAGTPTVTGNWYARYTPNTGVAAALGQVWTGSFYCRLSGGSLTNIAVINELIGYNGSSIAEALYQTITPTSAGLSTQRASVTETFASSSTNYVLHQIQFAYTVGNPVNVTLRIGMPQLEQSPYATSVISTSSAAVTRNADVYGQEPASYLDSTGTLQYEAANTVRTNYVYSGGSWVLGGTVASPPVTGGSLIEPAATNAIRNNTMSGAVVADGVERTTSGTFSGCSGSTCTGWTTNLNGGTGSISYGSNTATLTGDGTNAASIYQAIPTVSGYTYTIALTTGAGNAVTVQAGTSAGGANLLGATSQAASTTLSYQFLATGTSSYVQINNTSATPATVTQLSVQSAGKLPTNWSEYYPFEDGLTTTLVGVGTENGIAYTDYKISGTPYSSSNACITPEAYNGIAASNGQTWTASNYVKMTSGSLSNVTLDLELYSVNSSGTFLGNIATPTFSPTSAALGTQRTLAEGVISFAGTSYVNSCVQFYFTSGHAVNLTLRVGMPQLEQSVFATSAIPTMSAAETRNADVYSMPSGGTYFNSAGVLKTAAANTPRLDHSPISPYAPLGLLIEEGRANLVAYSSGTTGEVAGAGGGGNTTYVTSTTLAPDNTTDFLECIEAAASFGTTAQACHWDELATTSGSTTYTVSMFVKAGGVNVFTLLGCATNTGSGCTAVSSATVNLSAGTSTMCGSGLGGTTGIQSIGNGIYRVFLTYTTPAPTLTSSYFDVRMANIANPACAGTNFTGDGSSGLYIWGVQLEAGAQPTSYIPTAGASVTRAVDAFTVPGTAGSGSGWLSNNVGTFGTSGSINYLNGNTQAFAGLDNGSATQSISDQIGTSGKRAGAFYSSGQTYLGNTTAYTLGARTRILLAYSSSYENGAADGTLFGSGTTAPPATQSRLTIGHSRGTSNGDLDGWVSRIWYMPIENIDASLPQYTASGE